MPFCWLIGISYSLRSKSAMRCCEHANEKVVRELVLVGETRSRDGLKPGKEVLVGLVALGDGVE